ncbi:hypothetical protein BaRGS_00002280 [Batillaria attramentaria]|uniref:Uncharacterized protein n=1 Tax=Batillaria attramentaria TaxID=370345 RepID=A0ABD0M3A9_9CAEN
MPGRLYRQTRQSGPQEAWCTCRQHWEKRSLVMHKPSHRLSFRAQLAKPTVDITNGDSSHLSLCQSPDFIFWLGIERAPGNDCAAFPAVYKAALINLLWTAFCKLETTGPAEDLSLGNTGTEPGLCTGTGCENTNAALFNSIRRSPSIQRCLVMLGQAKDETNVT